MWRALTVGAYLLHFRIDTARDGYKEMETVLLGRQAKVQNTIFLLP